MIAFLSLLLHVVVSPFRTKARLEAEIILLRHQLNVLRRRVPSNPKLAVAEAPCADTNVGALRDATTRVRLLPVLTEYSVGAGVTVEIR